MSAFVKLMRLHQWSKNLFVLAGVVFSHLWLDFALLSSALFLVLAFCLASSATYILNDVVDRKEDAQHPKKRYRPIASGDISAGFALWMSGIMFLASVMVSIQVSYKATYFVVLYSGMTLLYCFFLKKYALIDVFCISSGFMLRILAGTVGLKIPPTHWILLCGFMLTLFLGFAKRRSELLVSENASLHRRVLSYYNRELLDVFLAVTAACALMSYSIYTVSPDTVLRHGSDRLVYTVPLVAFGIFRYLFLVHYRQFGADFARELIKDIPMLLVVAAWGLFFIV